jgi:peptidoglycan-associated lipoprotein
MILALLAMGISLGVGCAPKKDTTAGAIVPLPPTAAPESPVADDGIQTGGLHISEAIVRACNLHKAPPPPMFAFDSATLAEQDREVLAEVAKCFSDGPLRGNSVALIGRADPRGEDEYNMSLGESRADSVRRYLHDMGVAPQRVRATSRGDIDAIGLDEDGWARDRRVDIELASR